MTTVHHRSCLIAMRTADGRFTLSLARSGEMAKVHITSDEGILRFVGNVLSKFTAENLEN
jgi:hypothetical protein